MMSSIGVIYVFWFFSAILVAAQVLPVVDLGYELHQASINSSGGYYNFSNIRYAQPPIGDLRFRAPVPVSNVVTPNRTINDGSKGVVCPNANPSWLQLSNVFITDYLSGQPFDYYIAEARLQANLSAAAIPPNVPPQDQDPRTSEDCLFLDVIAPTKVYDGCSSSSGGGGRNASCPAAAPVLVWIYGGGYTAGDKSSVGNAAGLIRSSQSTGTDGVVYVAMNYRLGAFGWLAGPTLQSDGTANAALYDQRLALQWIQTNIHLFGGDPNRVTVVGESAGGGSIMHQITAFGGLCGPAPFQQAIPQSPGWFLQPSNLEQEQVFNSFLSLLNVTSIQEARQMPSEALITANALQVLNSTWGQFTYGPVVDGLFAPALPGKLLLQGSYDKNLKLMIGHNADEGLLFTPPYVTNDSAYTAFVKEFLPDITPDIVETIENYYPNNFNGSYRYTDEIGRTILTISESTFTCNTVYLDHAFGNQTFAYQFSIPPAIHGQDVAYTFFNGPSPAVKSDAIALALQEYITSFAINGVPSGPGIPMFPLYGNGSQVLNLNVSGISDIMDPSANERCSFWQKALYI